MRPVVVKIGGSLFECADLGPRLKAFLSRLAAPILVVPGGGAAANAIRDLDRIHRLGDEASHWLALRACAVNGHLLATLLDGVPVGIGASVTKTAVIDLFAFAIDDERRPDHWPHRWDVTSDSMALRVAQVTGASELILLKSTDIDDDGDWSKAAANGLVDPFFPSAVSRTPNVAVRALNFRACLEEST
jgi:aspartokinase-like uncharacterized kinase